MVEKKHGKGRLDKWYKLAKEKGYRARAAFKLIQLNKKYGFLENSKVVLDLCAAPGSWCQVAVETMPANGIIIGVDLSPIKPIPKVITFQSDITTEKCRATIRQHLKNWKADTVLHDGAPNVGTAWIQDSFNQSELVLQSMKLATEFLVEGGTFVTKVFRSKDYNSLLWVFNQLFAKVEATKPPSSRNVSAEIFVVCRGFKAPKRIDPRFLDPKAVFAELADPTPNNEARVFNPEVKKRKRDGYEEGNYTLYKEMPASEFIQTTDPIAVLGQYNTLTFDQPKNGDVALAALAKMVETTDEIRRLCTDLRVLSRRDFKMLLSWRLRVRERFGFPTKKTAAKPLSEETAAVDDMDEETKIEKDLQEMRDRANSKTKRKKRRDNEQKQKEIVRMQLNMTAPMDIGMEQADAMGEGALFGLKKMDKTTALQRIARGKMATINPEKAVTAAEHDDSDSGIGSSAETDEDEDDEDDEEDRLERELDGQYDQYQERRAAVDAKHRAKKAREHGDDAEWEGVSAGESDIEDSDGDLEEDSSDDDGDEGATTAATKSLLTDLDNSTPNKSGLSKRAQDFFSRSEFTDIMGDVDELEEEEEEEDDDDDEVEEEQDGEYEEVQNAEEVEEIEIDENDEDEDEDDIMPTKQEVGSDSEDDGNFEVVKRRPVGDEDDWEDEDRRRATADDSVGVDIITAEMMTLAHDLALGRKTKHDVVDDLYNRRAFRDKDGLPDWFLDDESKHDKVQRPITKAAADAIKEKMRMLNARPIKKVREAQARKKFKAAQKLEKLKKKSEMLLADEGMTEKEKGDSISKMLSKAAKKKPHIPKKVVVARGSNRGIQGRPKGVKGRYKIVDPRMKKDTRGLKRAAQRGNKRRK
ncbi:AdoMet-dependent rRNA methyltransferase SPB1 [Sporothrix schenckii 1099-18]|uniref:AdoMet-dependent rRNA methyltransferase SPB1 n=1 Tax=Sporothrix schenckii 1099-18 TaxID=1397361 RepID=A0A0F2M280_SPOSC|nr:AdoMet-dependent rRNA methyltransferase SPB1 [Sporothrix schenckii 1099-18]KJR83818.1 AdoMet-dependent rRNA methyltransferase SPB1 [Sporothrix schenckii 1099-18]